MTESTQDPILESEEMRKMFVGAIPADSTDEDFKAFFEGLGVTVSAAVITRRVKDIEAIKDKKSHFGFVTLESSAMVDDILLRREELVFNSKKIDVKRAVPKGETSPGAREKTKKLFIANLPKTGITEDELKKYLEEKHDSKYGTIESVEFVKKKDDQGNKTEENKGFGFIMVSSEDMADKMAIQHAKFDFGDHKLEIKKSYPKSDGAGGRGRGRGRGFGGQRGRGGAAFGGYPPYGYGPYGGGYGGDWGSYGRGYGYHGYVGGYGPPPARGRGRFAPY